MKSPLAERRCKACAPGTPALSEKRIALLLPKLHGWKLRSGELCKTYPFKDYHHTMAFVNAVAWMAHRQDHHPDLLVGYNRCEVRYSTHSVNGLSENDFICAAKVDALME
ncbi:MAG: 4a-hydroxytetrahydrobiopterin dehydratase [Tepidisphaeraceae bacterium]|jgi:4a-hydroxytetrahydrobiopterin dehydratase